MPKHEKGQNDKPEDDAQKKAEAAHRLEMNRRAEEEAALRLEAERVREKKEMAARFLHEYELSNDKSIVDSLNHLIDQWHNVFLQATEICTIKFIKTVLKKQLVWLILVLVVGLILQASRNVFMHVSPDIIVHSHTFVVFVNAMSLDLYLSIDAIKLIVRAVEEALHFLSAGRFPHSIPHFRGFDEPRMLNASSLRQTLKETTSLCGDLRTGWATLETFLRSQTNNVVCPILRATTPCGRAGEPCKFWGNPFPTTQIPKEITVMKAITTAAWQLHAFQLTSAWSYFKSYCLL